MASVNITLTGLASASEFGETLSGGRDQIQKIAELAANLRSGAKDATSYTVLPSSSDAVAAVAEVTATTAGSLGTVIGGVTVTTTFTTDQAGTAAKAITDINADATASKWVKASAGSTATKFYVTALVPGIMGNAITLTVTGTGASATGSGRLATGAGGDGGAFTYTI
jgi:hypothetical protein